MDAAATCEWYMHKARKRRVVKPASVTREETKLQECEAVLAQALGVPVGMLSRLELCNSGQEAELRRRAHDDPAVVVPLTLAFRHAVDARKHRVWWSGEVAAADGVHEWFRPEPQLVWRLKLMRALCGPLSYAACAQAAAAAELPAMLLEVLRAGNTVARGARWAAEAAYAVRCLASLSAHADGLEQLDGFVPLVCSALRRAGRSCPAERLVEAISLQLHAVYCLANCATTVAGLRAVGGSAAPVLLARLAAGSDPTGVLETQAASLLETLQPHLPPAKPRAPKVALRGGFGIAVAVAPAAPAAPAAPTASIAPIALTALTVSPRAGVGTDDSVPAGAAT